MVSVSVRVTIRVKGYLRYRLYIRVGFVISVIKRDVEGVDE